MMQFLRTRRLPRTTAARFPAETNRGDFRQMLLRRRVLALYDPHAALASDKGRDRLMRDLAAKFDAILFFGRSARLVRGGSFSSCATDAWRPFAGEDISEHPSRAAMFRSERTRMTPPVAPEGSASSERRRL
jgi:hypothetical protein